MKKHDSEPKIVKKSQLWSLIPLAGRNRFSTTFSDTIYLTPKRYDDWKSGNPRPSTVALIAHKKVHVDQYFRDSAFKCRYMTSRQWRLRYEAEAYAKQAYIRAKLDKRQERGRRYYVTKYANVLASKTYMLFKPFDELYHAIDKEYQKLVKNG